MSGSEDGEDRALNAAELDMVKETQPPEIGRKTSEELKALAHRLRTAHQRAHDVKSRQQDSVAKTGSLMEAIRRVDAELSRREEAETGKPSPSEFARKALEMKMAARGGQHPDPGRTSKTGMHPRKRTEEFAIGAPRSEMGRGPQQQKVAQGRKDSGKG
jgi:hypothetical protein